MGRRAANALRVNHVARPAKEKQQRKSRPGQTVPRRSCVSKSNLSEPHQSTYRPWAERKEREHKHWQEIRPASVESLTIHAEQRQQDLGNLQGFLVSRVSQHFTKVLDLHSCSCQTPTFTQASVSTVRYQYFSFATNIAVPTYKCSGCDSLIPADPIACGCFQTSPKDPSCWIDLAVLQLFVPLSLSSGLAATGGCPAACLNDLHGHESNVIRICHAAEFCKAINHQASHLTGQAPLPEFEDHHLEAAFLEYRRAAAVTEDLQHLDVDLGKPDPFADCPVCAIVSSSTLADGMRDGLLLTTTIFKLQL